MPLPPRWPRWRVRSPSKVPTRRVLWAKPRSTSSSARCRGSCARDSCARPPPPPEPPAPPPGVSGATREIQALRVVLADDDTPRAYAVAQELRALGVTVVVTDLEPSEM